MSAPRRSRLQGEMAAGQSRRRRYQALLRQRVVLGQRSAKLRHRCIRVGPGFLDALSPGLDQRLGYLLPQRRLFPGQLVELAAFLPPRLFAAGVLELAPGFADATGSLGAAIIVDRLLLVVGHLVVFVLV